MMETFFFFFHITEMSELTTYNEFVNYNIIWREDNITDMYTLDYLRFMCATEEEIFTAVPSSQPPPHEFSNAFVATYVSLKLQNIVKTLCKSVPHRKFFVVLKHLGKRGPNVSGVHVEISSTKLDSGQPFCFWFHYDIHSIGDCNSMCKDLQVWQSHLEREHDQHSEKNS